MDFLIKINKIFEFYFSVLFLIFLFETTANKIRTNIENENNDFENLGRKNKNHSKRAKLLW